MRNVENRRLPGHEGLLGRRPRRTGEQSAAIPSGRNRAFYKSSAARTLDQSKHGKALPFLLTALGLVLDSP